MDNFNNANNRQILNIKMDNYNNANNRQTSSSERPVSSRIQEINKTHKTR